MAHHGTARSRIAALTLAGALAVTAGLTFAASPAQAAGPTLTLSTTTVKDGQTVTVKGKGFVSKPTNLYVAICENPPTATNCDTDLSHVVQVAYDGSGSFTTKYKVHTTFTLFGPPKKAVDCATDVCVIGTTNSADPKDHTYNATAKFTVAKSGSSTTKPSTGSQATTPDTGSSTTSDPATSTATKGEQLPKTGSSPATPLIAATGIALTLAGGALIVANSRRRPRMTQV